MESQKMYSSTNGGLKNSQEERGKIFVGGMNKVTTTDGLRQFFCRFGEVEDAIAMWDKHQNRSRCFGYVKFRDPDVVQLVLRSKPHFIDDKEVDVKECLPRSVTLAQKSKVHKVFIGGLPHDVDEASVRRALQNYGKILEVLIVCEPQTQKPKGFAFVSFEKPESAAAAVNDHYVMVNGKKAEVKAIDVNKGRPQHGGYSHPGGYPPHNGSSMYYQHPPGPYGYGYPDYHSAPYGGSSGPWASGPWGPAEHSAPPPMMSNPSAWGDMRGPHAPPSASSWTMDPSGAHSAWSMSSAWQQQPAAAPTSSVAPTGSWSDPASAAAWQQHAAAAGSVASSHYSAAMYGTAAQPSAAAAAAPTGQPAAPASAGAVAGSQSAWVMPTHAAPPGPTGIAPPGTAATQSYNYHPYRR